MYRNHDWAAGEIEPRGVTGLEFIHGGLKFDHRREDVADVLVYRKAAHALVLWEPLRTKAPRPPKAVPWYCYSRTIIFYHSPYIVGQWPRLYRDGSRIRRNSSCDFVQWDQIEHRLGFTDFVGFEDEVYDLNGGPTVIWAKRRWWMRSYAKRITDVPIFPPAPSNQSLSEVAHA
jgi:hypothetical protein